MSARKLSAEEVRLPQFTFGVAASADVFALSSHRRAREALDFGLSVTEPGFHIFVVGEDRSGRMTATLAFLESAIALRAPPPDWIYLNDFRDPLSPAPYSLPPGVGRQLQRRIGELVPQLEDAIRHAFASEDYETQLRATAERLRNEVQKRVEALREEAQAHGLDIVDTPQGAMVAALNAEDNHNGERTETKEQRAALVEAGQRFADRLADIKRWAIKERAIMAAHVNDLNRQVAEQVTAPLFEGAIEEFADYADIAIWLAEMRSDVVENLDLFRPPPEDAAEPPEPPARRYSVNLLVDNSSVPHPPVVLEANPTYENVFGRIEYRQIGMGALQTDYTLVRAGSLHRANGGILVVRAEALARNAATWEFLKGALRDRAIRIEEPNRAGMTPIAGAPRPGPIPLEVKVVIVGAPRWYSAFFAVDPDFETYFKIKAEIDDRMDATPANLAIFARRIRERVETHANTTCDDSAITRLLAVAARWSDQRDKLTARFELIDDLVDEAVMLSPAGKSRHITHDTVSAALENRLRRNGLIEDRVREVIARGIITIDTTGAVVGQVNALTVRDAGDHTFGAPSRVTARASIGRLGVSNIERDVELGGPIQQKGVLVLQGFLAGRFARTVPLSFNCSITFEQSYGGVEGDSASMAELIAVLSDLSGVPVRQDIAITGSVDQRGRTQPVGGVPYKIEGFFRTCQAAGPLTGTQGVVIPTANRLNVVLHEDIADAIATGKFHVWEAAGVDEVIELLTGRPAGVPDADGHYPADSVYGRVVAQIERFDRVLSERDRA
ncbi:MAG TPA: AAA family ATPase [Candidatus Sulfotelmatobacter sp.]|nr:AAA family ATPase [Candidatus Sulfotelmatobacter sp.]